MKIIVTGGAGFIGSNLVSALNNRGETEILIVDHLDHPSKRANLEALKYERYMDKEEFREAVQKQAIPVPEIVFHLGACTSTLENNREYLYENNFLYTRELCLWSIKHNARFVYASSASVYGDGSLGFSDDEKLISSLQPLNLYAWSKYLFDKWAMEEGLLKIIVGIRYFNVYGPREDHKGEMRSVVNKAYDEICSTSRIRLFKSYRQEYRDGEQKRDFIYVRDAVDVTLYLAEQRNVGGIFNCGTGLPRTWLDLAYAVFNAMSSEPNIVFIDMPEQIRDKYQYYTCADLTKLRATGYKKEFTSLEEGVRDYVQNWLMKRK